ncbi:hypothetical protein B0H67DRAFT_537883 [Lasiosphaeris hirsuta]|uniref:Uncharacterized protein n=1 Tax=Lasiosphaeris hirsuta TaxID=260670 RepID=A0AA40DTD2_9PEZI|nr:hypothetical protein B0H67DRAFT_537883 [Lasiosphaeris hirsuta]
MHKAFVEVPSNLISGATLRFIGYDDVTASKLWLRWINWPSDPPLREVDDSDHGMPFIEFAKGRIEGRDDAVEDDDATWHACFNVCGISRSTQNAIMDPVYRRVRLTRSCLFWIEDTMETRYRTLQSMQRASRGREMALERARSQPSGSASTTNQAVSFSSHGGRRSISSTQQEDVGLEADTAMSARALAAQNAQGFTLLWKGISQLYLDGLFDSNGNVVGISRLVSLPQTDFCRGPAFYFVVDRDIAVYYANYAKRRANYSSAVLVRIAIPNPAIEGMSSTERLTVYWPSEEWKELVFRSRRFNPYPSHLRKYKQATLIIGSIAGKPTPLFVNMDSPSQITEPMVLKNAAGQHAVQYVWPLEPAGEDFLLEHGAPHLKVYHLTREENEAWEAAHQA